MPKKTEGTAGRQEGPSTPEYFSLRVAVTPCQQNSSWTCFYVVETRRGAPRLVIIQPSSPSDTSAKAEPRVSLAWESVKPTWQPLETPEYLPHLTSTISMEGQTHKAPNPVYNWIEEKV